MAKKNQKSNVKWIAIALVVVLCAVGAAFALTGDKTTPTGSMEPTDYVQIDIENYGTITAELYGGIAPITVENFMNLVDEGFYDGLTFLASSPAS